MILSLRLLAAACLVAFLAALPSAAVSAPTDSPAASTAAAKCVAQIRKGNKLVPVYEATYAYKFVKVRGTSRFQRVVKRVRRKVKVSCAKQCVVMKKKKKKLR